MKKVDLTYDQGKERQYRWRKLCKQDWKLECDPNDAELLNWLSMNFHVSRKFIQIEDI